MKSKMIRLFAVLSSVLVLLTCLVVPSFAYNPILDQNGNAVNLDAFAYRYTVSLTDLYSVNSVGNIEFQIPDTYMDYVVRISYEGNVQYFAGERIRAFQQGQNDVYTIVLACDNPSSLLVNIGEFGVTSIDFSNNDVYMDYSGSLDEIVFDIFTYSELDVSLAPYAQSQYISLEVNEIVNASSVLGVFGSITDWIVSGVSSVQGVFYANNQLTMLGTLAVIGVAIAVAFLIIAVVQRFLHLRG